MSGNDQGNKVLTLGVKACFPTDKSLWNIVSGGSCQFTAMMDVESLFPWLHG